MTARVFSGPLTFPNSRTSRKLTLGFVGWAGVYPGSLKLFRLSNPPPLHTYPLSNSTLPARLLPTDPSKRRLKSQGMISDGPADEVARIEREFKGMVTVTVLRDSSFKVVFDTLKVRFRSCRAEHSSQHCSFVFARSLQILQH